jgi:allene oxide cyclase
MKRIFTLSVLVLAVAVAVAASVALAARSGGPGHGKKQGKAIQVVEHATTDAITNPPGGATAVVGDVLTFENDVFDKSNSTKVGHDQGFCVRMVGASWECMWTTFLDRGQITVEGPFYDTKDSVLAITGGTGAYARIRGSMELKARPGGTEYDFIFHPNH